VLSSSARAPSSSLSLQLRHNNRTAAYCLVSLISLPEDDPEAERTYINIAPPPQSNASTPHPFADRFPPQRPRPPPLPPHGTWSYHGKVSPAFLLLFQSFPLSTVSFLVSQLISTVNLSCFFCRQLFTTPYILFTLILFAPPVVSTVISTV